MNEGDDSVPGISQEGQTIRVRRNVYKQRSFDDEFKLSKPKHVPNEDEEESSKFKEACGSFGLKLVSYLHPMNILNLFTIFNLVASYNFKKTLIADILSGLTVGVMHIPGKNFTIVTLKI